jgi:hypothetical protein
MGMVSKMWLVQSSVECSLCQLLKIDCQFLSGPLMTETGLPGLLIMMLDVETDPALVKDVKECLLSMLLALGEQNLQFWLRLCKEVLTVATGTHDALAVTNRETSLHLMRWYDLINE